MVYLRMGMVVTLPMLNLLFTSTPGFTELEILGNCKILKISCLSGIKKLVGQ